MEGPLDPCRPLVPLEVVRRALHHGVGVHVALRAGGSVRHPDDPVFELSKDGRVRRLPFAEYRAGTCVRSGGYVPSVRLAAAHARIERTLGRDLGYGLFRGWTCDQWAHWVETGERRLSPQVQRGLGILGSVTVGLLAVVGLATRRRLR